MLNNYKNDIKEFEPIEHDIWFFADWLQATYDRNKQGLSTQHNYDPKRDRNGFLGEFTFYHWLHHHADPTAIYNRVLWDGYKPQKYGDVCDFEVVVVGQGLIRIDNKNITVSAWTKEFIAGNEVKVLDDKDGAKQISKPIDIYTFTGIRTQLNKPATGTDPIPSLHPYVLGWEYKSVVLQAWRVVEVGEKPYDNANYVCERKEWRCPVRELRPIDELPAILALT